MFRKIIASVAVAGALTLPAAFAPANAEGKVLNFGIISTEAATNLKRNWEPFLKDMAEKTGLQIKGFYASDYAGVIEGMRFKKVDAAWFGNKSAMEAVDRAGGEVFAQTVDSEGNPGYWSLILVHKDSPYEKLEDILTCDKSLDFGIGDPNSTSGFLVPTTYVFAAHKVDPKDCFKTVRNANHEANAMAVANKQVDAATNNTENLRRLEKTHPEAFKNIKVIWKSPLIPSDPIVWRADLAEATKGKLYRFFLSYGRMGAPAEVAKARKILAALQWAPFRPSSDAQLLPIRQLEINKQILKLQADGKMPEAEKNAKLAELRRKNDDIARLMEQMPGM